MVTNTNILSQWLTGDKYDAARDNKNNNNNGSTLLNTSLPPSHLLGNNKPLSFPARTSTTADIKEPRSIHKLEGSGATSRIRDEMASSSGKVSTTASGFAIQAEKNGILNHYNSKRFRILMIYAEDIRPPARQSHLLNPNSTIILEQQ